MTVQDNTSHIPTPKNSIHGSETAIKRNSNSKITAVV